LNTSKVAPSSASRQYRCVESEASTAAEVVVEVAAARLTERGATRADDRISEAGMEDRKKEGYF
jgi:sulfate adenylyltransferase subunit 2